MINPDFEVVRDTSLKKKMNVVTFLTTVAFVGAGIFFMKYEIFEHYPGSGFVMIMITVGPSVAYYCWKIFRYKCPKCGLRLSLSHDRDRPTFTYDCTNCHIIWDSTIVKKKGSSGDSFSDTF